MTKICSKCGIEKCFSEFRKQKQGKFGLHASCKSCDKEYRDRYRSRPEYKQERNEYLRKARDSERFRELEKKRNDRYRFGGNRDYVLKRDNYTCQWCGSIENLLIHHKDGNGRRKPKKEMNNNPDNLVTVCATCHTRHHSNEWWGKNAINS